MPLPTFENLPEPKRARLMAALKAEFAAHPYRQASVERITTAAGVSKGSFYQYFTDKEDAYRHLLAELMRDRLGLEGTPVPDASFEQVLTGMLLSSQEYQRRDPQGWAVLSRALADDAPPFLLQDESVLGGLHGWAVGAIAAGQASGELRDDVAPETAAWLVERVLLGLPQHVTVRFQIDPAQAATDGSAFARPEVAQVGHDAVALLVAAMARHD